MERAGRFLNAGKLRMHILEDGPADGELVLLLHGFPELAYGFRRQLQPLADAGYHVVAPDQRGYNLTERPEGLDAYRLDVLGEDVIHLMDALGARRAHVVGHDWGGCVAWWVACRYPERVATLTALNMPHWAVMERALKTRLSQLKRSWYILLFQLPWLPELLLANDDFARLARTLYAFSERGSFSPADLAVYKAAWARPGALTAMLAWYRAALQRQPQHRPDTRVHAPTRIIWGLQDEVFDRELIDESADLCDDVRIDLLPHANHFVQHDAAEEVNAALLDHLRAHPIP